MYLLSLDPGITTGYALFQDGDLVESGNILIEDFQSSILSSYANREDVDVIVETIPTPTLSRLNRRLIEIIAEVVKMFPNATPVAPGNWKPNRAVRSVKFPRDRFPSPSPHQLDAFYIGIYALTFLGGQK